MLAEQRRVHAVDQAQVVLEVGDHPGGVGEPRELGECGAALEVDEHEAQLLGAVRRGEAADDRAQQLALSRPGRADDQPVRPHASFGGLLEVEHQAVAVLGQPDRRAQLPGRLIEQVGQADLGGEVDARGALLQAQGRELPSERLGGCGSQLVEHHRADPVALGAGALEHGGVGRRRHDPQRRLRRLGGPLGDQADGPDLELLAARGELADQRHAGDR